MIANARFNALSLALLLALLLGSAAFGRGEDGRSYLFDGTSFREAGGTGAIFVRDGLLPAVATEKGVPEDPLPAGTGAVALFCYVQGGGGKLKPQPRVIPMTGAAITVQGKKVTLASRSDASGYLILALPPGNYHFKLLGFDKQIAVEQGKTTLAFLRGGKRMVD